MSVLVRIKTERVLYKARIYERCSKKQNCSVCGRRADGLLVRHTAPEKKDTGICNECIVRITLGRQITVEGKTDIKFGEHPRKPQVAGKKRGRHKKPGIKPGGERFPCEKCGKTFTEHGMKLHLAQKHIVSSVTDDLDGTKTEKLYITKKVTNEGQRKKGTINKK